MNFEYPLVDGVKAAAGLEPWGSIERGRSGTFDGYRQGQEMPRNLSLSRWGRVVDKSMRTLRPLFRMVLWCLRSHRPAFSWCDSRPFRPVALIEPPATSFSRLKLFGKTLALAGLVDASSCALGGWFAWLDARSQFAHRNLRRILLLVPMAIPSYVLASILRQTFAPKGIVGSVLGVRCFHRLLYRISGAHNFLYAVRVASYLVSDAKLSAK